MACLVVSGRRWRLLAGACWVHASSVCSCARARRRFWSWHGGPARTRLRALWLAARHGARAWVSGLWLFAFPWWVGRARSCGGAACLWSLAQVVLLADLPCGVVASRSRVPPRLGGRRPVVGSALLPVGVRLLGAGVAAAISGVGPSVTVLSYPQCWRWLRVRAPLWGPVQAVIAPGPRGAASGSWCARPPSGPHLGHVAQGASLGWGGRGPGPSSTAGLGFRVAGPTLRPHESWCRAEAWPRAGSHLGHRLHVAVGGLVVGASPFGGSRPSDRSRLRVSRAQCLLPRGREVRGARTRYALPASSRSRQPRRRGGHGSRAPISHRPSSWPLPVADACVRRVPD